MSLPNKDAWIIKGWWQLGIPVTVCQTHHHATSPPPCLWMRCRGRRTAGTGRNRTTWNKKPLHHLQRWHFPQQSERERASGVHPSPRAGFWSCRNVMPPCGLCAGTRVRHSTRVGCSWTVLLVCVSVSECVCWCVCFCLRIKTDYVKEHFLLLTNWRKLNIPFLFGILI